MDRFSSCAGPCRATKSFDSGEIHLSLLELCGRSGELLFQLKDAMLRRRELGQWCMLLRIKGSASHCSSKPEVRPPSE